MNTTDERRFRLDLAQALDASAHDIAPLETAALVGAGARRVRRRRVAGGAATMVGVLTLGGGSWALVNAPGRSQVIRPANRHRAESRRWTRCARSPSAGPGSPRPGARRALIGAIERFNPFSLYRLISVTVVSREAPRFGPAGRRPSIPIG